MDKMIPLLEKFADKLGTTAEYLWGVLVRQQIVSSVVELSVFVVCVVAIVLIVKFWDKIYEADWDMAAVAIVVTEAGGQFSDLENNPGPFGKSGVSTNGHLHEVFISSLTSNS